MSNLVPGSLNDIAFEGYLPYTPLSAAFFGVWVLPDEAGQGAFCLPPASISLTSIKAELTLNPIKSTVSVLGLSSSITYNSVSPEARVHKPPLFVSPPQNLLTVAALRLSDDSPKALITVSRLNSVVSASTLIKSDVVCKSLDSKVEVPRVRAIVRRCDHE